MISRFSEDIDLTIGKQYLGIVDEDDPLTAPSRKSRTKRLKQLVFRAETAVGETIYSLLNERFGQYLSDEWSLTVDESDLQTLLFDYPKVEDRSDKQMHYIKRVVRLEFGARGDPWPTEEHIITPYVAEALPDQFTQSQIAVNVLKIVRTFWEKIYP